MIVGDELPVYHIQISNVNDVTGRLALDRAYKYATSGAKGH